MRFERRGCVWQGINASAALTNHPLSFITVSLARTLFTETSPEQRVCIIKMYIVFKQCDPACLDVTYTYVHTQITKWRYKKNTNTHISLLIASGRLNGFIVVCEASDVRVSIRRWVTTYSEMKEVTTNLGCTGSRRTQRDTRSGRWHGDRPHRCEYTADRTGCSGDHRNQGNTLKRTHMCMFNCLTGFSHVSNDPKRIVLMSPLTGGRNSNNATQINPEFHVHSVFCPLWSSPLNPECVPRCPQMCRWVRFLTSSAVGAAVAGSAHTGAVFWWARASVLTGAAVGAVWSPASLITHTVTMDTYRKPHSSQRRMGPVQSCQRFYSWNMNWESVSTQSFTCKDTLV